VVIPRMRLALKRSTESWGVAVSARAARCGLPHHSAMANEYCPSSSTVARHTINDLVSVHSRGCLARPFCEAVLTGLSNAMAAFLNLEASPRAALWDAIPPYQSKRAVAVANCGAGTSPPVPAAQKDWLGRKTTRRAGIVTS